VPLYTFRLRGDGANVQDDDGVTLATDEVAFRYAHDVARELMNHQEANTRHWCLDIYADGKRIGEIPFMAAGQTLDDVPTPVIENGEKARLFGRQMPSSHGRRTSSC
jgi:uncharacterized protein DUF6894